MKLLPALGLLLLLVLLLVMNFEFISARKVRHRGTKKPCTRHKHHRPTTRPSEHPVTEHKKPASKAKTPCTRHKHHQPTARPSEHPVTEHKKPASKAKTPCTRHKHRRTTQVPHTTSSRLPTVVQVVTPTACKKTPCVVSEWSKWSKCSSLCGNNGVTQRSRKVLTEASCGGTPCVEYPLREVKPCNRLCLNGGTPFADHCKCQVGYDGICCEKVNGNWSPWSKWSQCSRSCGNGTRQRMRSCDNPSPANGGRGCEGDDHETVECNERECPVDGGWSPWGIWSPCTSTCGHGQKFRLRQCSNPFPLNGGKMCLGPRLLISPCQLPECRIPGGNAGSGAVGKRHVVKRRRLLNHINSANINNFEDIVQKNLEILSNREDRTSTSGPWTSWSSCSVTCGAGQRFRLRACQDLANPCVGVPMETQDCEMGECPP